MGVIASKSSNIQVSVELHEDDSDPNKPGLPLIYGNYGEPNFVTTRTTSITPKEKK